MYVLCVYVHVYDISHYLPVKAELSHSPVHFSHDIIGSALAPDTEVPLGLLHCQGFGPGGVESIERTTGLGAVSQERRHPLWVGFHPGGQLHALFYEGALGRTGGQVELTGLRHDAPVVYYKVVGYCQLILHGQREEESQLRTKEITHLR